jgi:hypothetical protein
MAIYLSHIYDRILQISSYGESVLSPSLWPYRRSAKSLDASGFTTLFGLGLDGGSTVNLLLVGATQNKWVFESIRISAFLEMTLSLPGVLSLQGTIVQYDEIYVFKRDLEVIWRFW